MSVKPKIRSEVLDAVKRAFEHAAAARHLDVTEGHLAAALLEDGGVKEAVAACGADAEELRDVALGSLDDARPRPWYRRRPRYHVHVTNVISSAVTHAMSAELDEVTPLLVMIRLLDHEEPSILAERLDAMGLELLPLKRFMAHGTVRPSGPEGVNMGRCQVVLHNDPFTTREFVIEALEEEFALTEEEAMKVMLAAHHQGTSRVTTMACAQAAAAAESVISKAEAQGFPFKITLEPA